MIITGNDSQFIEFVKKRLSEKFLMSDLGPLRYFIGLEVSFTPDGIYLLCSVVCTREGTTKAKEGRAARHDTAWTRAHT